MKNDEKLKFMRSLTIINHAAQRKRSGTIDAFVLTRLDGIMLAGPRVIDVINRVIRLRHVRLMITLSYCGKFNLPNRHSRALARCYVVQGRTEDACEVHDDEDFTGGHDHYPRRSFEIVQESSRFTESTEKGNSQTEERETVL